MKSIQGVLAPAKLNLFLHITGQRADGYHLLQSVFMLIDWYDYLDFELRPDGLIERVDLRAENAQISDPLSLHNQHSPPFLVKTFVYWLPWPFKKPQVVSWEFG